MNAVIIAHPSSKVTFDPPAETQASVVNAIVAHDAELAAVYTPPTEEQWQRLEGCEAVGQLVETFGAKRVASWVRFQAALKGQDIERPADRCLADGAALNHGICVQCGRDNS